MPKRIQMSYCVHLSQSGTVCSGDGAHTGSCTMLIIKTRNSGDVPQECQALHKKVLKGFHQSG